MSLPFGLQIFIVKTNPSFNQFLNVFKLSEMKNRPFQVPYGRSIKHQREQQDDDEQLKNYPREIQDEYVKSKTSRSKEFYKKSRPSKKKHRQKINNEQRNFPWDDRYRGKNKSIQSNQKSSQKQKLKLQQKNINYDIIFRELSYGNSTDVVAAAIQYKEVLQSLIDHIIGKVLDMDFILTHKKINPTFTKRQHLQQSIPSHQKMFKKVNQIHLEISSGDFEESIQVPLKNPSQKKTLSEQKRLEQNKFSFEFTENKNFMQEFRNFKRVSSLSNNIITEIPYKSISSLYIIQSLSFIIQKTSLASQNKLFEADDSFVPIYKEINIIAQSSKTYLIQEKLKKGLRYFAEVENKLNKIYQKKGSKSKLNHDKSDTNIANCNTKDDSGSQFEERKTSAAAQETNAIIEESKQDYQKDNKKEK